MAVCKKYDVLLIAELLGSRFKGIPSGSNMTEIQQDQVIEIIQ